VGEKRLDLALMESDLRGHDLVADAALSVLERAGEPRVAAVLVLTPAGERLLRAEGRRGLARRLSDHLARSWDAVLTPRAWRTVPALPEDRRGKTTTEALHALFETPAGESPPGARTEDRPVVLSKDRDGAAVEWSCRVPEQLSCWPGHFPDFLVVPGVLQLDWAMDAASELLGELPRIGEMSRVTFRETLGPGDAFRIRVEATPDGWIRFRIWSEGIEYASGRAQVLRAAETEA
jgi:3-hydroxymyristoyl/3-hydroxydecanoyl-(acyl carrier protein) dehydratase